jgi:hypothetical protein
VLDEVRDADLKVLVIWEKIGFMDARGPSTWVLSRIPDARAVQYWDPERIASSELRRTLSFQAPVVGDVRLVQGDPIWDAVFVFDADAKWEQGKLVPAFAGAPPVEIREELKSALQRALAKEEPGAAAGRF